MPFAAGLLLENMPSLVPFTAARGNRDHSGRVVKPEVISAVGFTGITAIPGVTRSLGLPGLRDGPV
jgi:hypothetical protein